MSKSKLRNLKKKYQQTEFLSSDGNYYDYVVTQKEMLEALSYQKRNLLETKTPPNQKKEKKKRKGLAVQSKSYLKDLVQKCIARHDWLAAVSMLKILLDSNLMKVDLPFLLENVVIVLQEHPDSSPDMLEDFKREISSETSRPFHKLCGCSDSDEK